MNSVSKIDTISSTSLMSVNPAFLQEIKDSNLDYFESIRRIRHICHSSDDPPEACRTLVKALDHLRDVVALQFSLEESYGYMIVGDLRDFGTTETPITRQSAACHCEHRNLYIQLSELAELAQELQYRGVEQSTFIDLCSQVSYYADQLMNHERGEAELIQRTLLTLHPDNAFPVDPTASTNFYLYFLHGS